MWPNARTTKIQALFSLPILSYRWASEAQESEVTLPGHGRARTCPRQAGSAPQTEYGALISKGDHKKFSPYSSFLLHPGKKEVSRKGLLKMSLISQMLLFFLKSMSLCMEKRSPPPNPKSAKSSETLHGVKSIILISFSKCLFSKSYNNCFRNGGKRTKVLLLLLFEQYAIQWLYWTCIHFRLKKTRRGGGVGTQPQAPVEQGWFSGRTPGGVLLHPASKSSLSAVYPCTSITEPWFWGHQNQYRLGRSERSVCKEAEVAEGSLWKELCWETPRGVSAKRNRAAQSGCRGGKQSSLQQEDPKILQCLPTRRAKVHQQMKISLRAILNICMEWL